MRAARLARNAALALFGSLIVGLTAWHWTHLRGAGLAAALALTVLPLLVPLRGLARLERYTYRWAALTLVPSMAWSLTELVASPGSRVIAAALGMAGFLALAAIVAVLRTLPAPAGGSVSAAPGRSGPAAR